MTSPIIPDFITKIFAQEIARINLQLLKAICDRHDLDFDIEKKFLKDKIDIDLDVINENIEIFKKKRSYGDNISPEDRCKARTFNIKDHDFKQCCRKHMPDVLFCKLHERMNKENKLKYGDISGDVPEDILEKIKKINKRTIY
jgi:hypothetical protein